MAYNDGTNHFVFPTDGYSYKGTDRCGDGIMDGPITYTNATDGVTMTLRAGDYPTPDKDWSRTTRITGYTRYWDNEYSQRMLSEQCDNGGDTDHGCDRLCQIVPGWECFHYYHHIVSMEEPYFTSICQETAHPWLERRRRRLSPEDFDHKGRMLHHLPRKAYFYQLPLNEHAMRVGKHTLMFNEKEGLNGQVRILDSPDCATCYGFTMAYQRDVYTDADWWYYGVSISTDTVPVDALTASGIVEYPVDDGNIIYAAADLTTAEGKTDLAAGVMNGKQRNTFGPYMVVNDGLDKIKVYGYEPSGADTVFNLIWTSTAEASVQYLGAHEFYWFPH